MAHADVTISEIVKNMAIDMSSLEDLLVQGSSLIMDAFLIGLVGLKKETLKFLF
jgi:hypothetical protein